MSRQSVRRYLLPLLLGLLGLLLLVRILVINSRVLVPEDMDVVALVVVLGLALVAAIHTIVRLAMSQLRQRSIRRARRQVVVEHRRFLSRLDHELKNPLTALRAGLQTLLLTSLDAQQQRIVETLEVETLRLSRLVADLRKLAELEAQPLNLQPVDLQAFVYDIMQMERERFEAGERRLTCKVEGTASTWVLDEDLLALAVHNLLDNALKYSRPGDAVELAVIANQELILRVADTGVGIPHADLAHVWEELYRAEQAEKTPGSGIGLALVKAIVERHDGSVDVESESGAGTTITLRLPAGIEAEPEPMLQL